VQFHYALVDDLFSREEFERRVEEKMESCGDLVDEVTAAMMVVQDCGRHHVKIKDLSGKSSLFSFFGRVVAKNPPREFERPGGEKGLVTSLILGDETGQVRAILWDEKAMAAREIEVGEVLEVIGRHPNRTPTEITVMAMRQAMVEIVGPTQVEPSLAPPKRRDLTVRVIAIGEPRMVPRRDGTEAEVQDLIVGNQEGLFRMSCWVPDIIEGITEGAALKIQGALEKVRRYGKEYSIDERSSIGEAPGDIPVEIHSIEEVEDGGSFSVCGHVKSCRPVRTFSTKDGRVSCVRNLVLTDGTHQIRVVLWGEEHARTELLAGDQVALYLCSARKGRSGDLELHAGRGSMVKVQHVDEAVEEEITGTVIATSGGTFLDTGEEQFLVRGTLPHGHEVRARVTRRGKRISIHSFEELLPDTAELNARIDAFLAKADQENTFTPHGRQDISK
jgi:replication factor A1